MKSSATNPDFERTEGVNPTPGLIYLSLAFRSLPFRSLRNHNFRLVPSSQVTKFMARH